jgi:hypothetical protein
VKSVHWQLKGLPDNSGLESPRNSSWIPSSRRSRCRDQTHCVEMSSPRCVRTPQSRSSYSTQPERTWSNLGAFWRIGHLTQTQVQHLRGAEMGTLRNAKDSRRFLWRLSMSNLESTQSEWQTGWESKAKEQFQKSQWDQSWFIPADDSPIRREPL